MIASIARTYDRWAPDYDRRWCRYTDVTLGVLLDHLVLDRSPDIFDVGCGTGTLLASLRARAPQAHLLGVDVNSAMLRIARAKLEGMAVALCHGTAYHLPVADQSVDVVTVASVVHYLKRPSIACAEVRRVLRPGGTLVMVDYVPRGGWGSVMDGLIRLYDRGHVRSRDMY
jgi:ubiquinone/menaquinone biosynthesis C-methylase UbiE